MDMKAKLDAQVPKPMPRRPKWHQLTQFQAPRHPPQCLGAHATRSHHTSNILAPRRPSSISMHNQPAPAPKHQAPTSTPGLVRLAPRRPYSAPKGQVQHQASDQDCFSA
ncbi:hypothetical protein PIB30_056209 [Stylosanthes scabra]|uniref:Uncharacterized protein n=1 Tax=Stylosanthes scabra TaxID=79078 RepID=A0ABU6ZI20_9FABA|nr:hypothetical protein [Stylosanthes scabra]